MPDPYDVLASAYDALRTFTDDLTFWQTRTAGAHRILELGVGTGRVATVLARAGRTVFGIDRAPAMLVRIPAETDPGRVLPVVADLRTFALRATFDAIIAPMNVVMELASETDIDAMLTRCRAHAHEATQLTVTSNNPHRGPRPFARERSVLVGAHECLIRETVSADGPIHVRTIRSLVAANGSILADTSILARWFAPGELDAFATRSGWRLIDTCGDYAGAEMSDHAPYEISTFIPI